MEADVLLVLCILSKENEEENIAFVWKGAEFVEDDLPVDEFVKEVVQNHFGSQTVQV